MWIGLIQLVIGLIVLILGGEFLIQSSVKLARYFKVDPIVIGLTIISFGTSFPELVVSLNAALSGHPDISLGNVVGSNIANLALVLGVASVIKPISVSLDTQRIDWPLLIFITIVFLLTAWFWEFSFYAGVVYVLLLLAYNFFMMRRGKLTADEVEEVQVVDSKGQMIRTALILILSFIALIFGSDVLVDGAVAIAQFWDVEESVIAVTIIAFGTSVPELATSLIAIRRGELGLGVGNLIGSNIFNVLGIVGITSLFETLVINDHLLNFDLWLCSVLPVFIFPFIIIQKSISRGLGFILLASYLGYILYFF